VAARCSVERLSALLRYEDEVLVTQAESPSNIDPRFDAEDVADLERLDVASRMYGTSWILSPTPCPVR
jgi:hypothetical protein